MTGRQPPGWGLSRVSIAGLVVVDLLSVGASFCEGIEDATGSWKVTAAQAWFRLQPEVDRCLE